MVKVEAGVFYPLSTVRVSRHCILLHIF